MINLNDDEINVLVMGLINLQEQLAKEVDKRTRHIRVRKNVGFVKEKERDLKLLPDLINKLNHAKNVTVMGRYKYAKYDWRFDVQSEKDDQ